MADKFGSMLPVVIRFAGEITVCVLEAIPCSERAISTVQVHIDQASLTVVSNKHGELVFKMQIVII